MTQKHAQPGFTNPPQPISGNRGASQDAGDGGLSRRFDRHQLGELPGRAWRALRLYLAARQRAGY